MRAAALRLPLAALAVVVFFAACSKEKAVDKPAELIDIESTLRVDRLWNAAVGGGEPVLRLGLGLAVDEGRIFAAGHDGDVISVDLASGRTLWRTRTKTTLSGGTGAGAGLVAVGSADGEVLALAAEDGAIRWRTRVRGEVLAAPAVSASAVIVRTVDGRLRALALDDGRELWNFEQPVPRLSLRGTAPPVVAGNTVIAGFDNGKVIALATATGEIVWEATISSPRGRTELERLNDIDAAVQIDGDEVLVVGFQGRAAMLALESGQVWWSRDLSSHSGLAATSDAVFVSTAEGDVVALQRRTGVELWRQDALKRRSLSAPAVIGDSVAVADFDGVLHWLDRSSGAFVARSKVGTRVSNALQVVDRTLLVIDDSGRLSAFRPREARTPPQ